MWGRRLAALIIALVVAPLTSLLLSLFTGGWGALIMLFFLFIRFVPMIAIFEVRTLLPEAKVHVAHGEAHGAHPASGHSGH